jgi:hypothetical protein
LRGKPQALRQLFALINEAAKDGGKRHDVKILPRLSYFGLSVIISVC